MNPRPAAFRRLLFFAGAFNISLAIPLTIPGVPARYLGVLSALNAQLGLGGQRLEAPAMGAPSLLANTAGIALVLVGVLLVYAGFDPAGRAFIPLANAMGRLLFAVVAGYSVFAFDLARIVLAIAAIDLLLAIGFLFCLLVGSERARRTGGGRAGAEPARPRSPARLCSHTPRGAAPREP